MVIFKVVEKLTLASHMWGRWLVSRYYLVQSLPAALLKSLTIWYTSNTVFERNVTMFWCCSVHVQLLNLFNEWEWSNYFADYGKAQSSFIRVSPGDCIVVLEKLVWRLTVMLKVWCISMKKYLTMQSLPVELGFEVYMHGVKQPSFYC